MPEKKPTSSATLTFSAKVKAGSASTGKPPPEEGFAVAAAHLNGGLSFLDTDDADGDLSALWSYTFLAGFAVEAKLKFFLSKQGVGVKHLKKIGHNLDELWKEAHSSGLGATDKAPEWLQQLNKLHRSFDLRYRQESRITVFTNKEVLTKGLAQLDELLGRALGK